MASLKSRLTKLAADLRALAADAGQQQVQQLLEQVFSARGYPIQTLNWFPRSTGPGNDAKMQQVLEQVLQIPRGSWTNWGQLASLIRDAAPKVPDFASFERLQSLRRTQQNPRWRVQQQPNVLEAKEYKDRAVAATQELQQKVRELVFDDQRGKDAKRVIEDKLRQLVAGFQTTQGDQLARNLSMIVQYLEPVAMRADFVNEGPNKATILTSNRRVLDRFRALTEALGYRRGAKTQRF